MITEPEARGLLAAAMAYDNRKAGGAVVKAWLEAGDRARWTFSEALDAVHAHYAERTEFLVPGHITERVRAARADAAMREPIEQPDPIGQQRLTELISGAFRAIGDDGDRESRRAAVAVRCPFCHAGPGVECTRASRRGPVRREPHPSRFESAA